eukprot:Skav200734  [mRNA]  locus=scaffold274:198180:198954:- [translate_table: standard]
MVKKILRILKEVDKDGSGSTEFDEFVEFFRKAEPGATAHPEGDLAVAVETVDAQGRSHFATWEAMDLPI